MSQLSFEAQVESDHLVRVPEDLPIGTRVRVMIEPITERPTGTGTPRVSALGQRLAAVRQRAVDRGMVLKSADEILAEGHEGRAEAADDQDLR